MDTYTLTAAGQAALRARIREVDKRALRADAYFDDAENEATDAFSDGRDAVIEVWAIHSISGYPETITLDPAWFYATPG